MCSSYSSEFVVTSGVPQGSLLGPLFFLVYINDIANCDSLIPLLFADDAKFLGLYISSMAFQDDLDRLFEWSVKIRLYFNHEKCAHVNFNGKSYPLYFENNQITMTENQKDLSLLVDSGLRWKTHIEKACSKANAVFFQIKRNVSNLSMKTKLELYKSMIVPTLIYASSCIGLSKYVSSCLEKTQKRMVKWITASNWDYENSLTTLGILPLTMYIQINDILLLSKIIQGGYDVNQLKVPDLSYSVRGEIMFQISRPKKAVVQQSFVYRTTRIVN